MTPQAASANGFCGSLGARGRFIVCKSPKENPWPVPSLATVESAESVGGAELAGSVGSAGSTDSAGGAENLEQ